MSGGYACRCGKRESWRVVNRNCNHSAFNGGHWTWSRYSALYCLACRAWWRTKAAYTDTVKSMTDAEKNAWRRNEL